MSDCEEYYQSHRGATMSYDIYLTEPITGERVQLDTPHQMRGGNFAIGGTNEAWLNITWNYGDIYRRENVLGEKGIRAIYGMTGADSIPVLQKAADALRNDTSSNYWDATDGNAKRPLLQLIALAKMRPDAIWEGD